MIIKPAKHILILTVLSLAIPLILLYVGISQHIYPLILFALIATFTFVRNLYLTYGSYLELTRGKVTQKSLTKISVVEFSTVVSSTSGWERSSGGFSSMFRLDVTDGQGKEIKFDISNIFPKKELMSWISQNYPSAVIN